LAQQLQSRAAGCLLAFVPFTSSTLAFKSAHMLLDSVVFPDPGTPEIANNKRCEIDVEKSTKIQVWKQSDHTSGPSLSSISRAS